MKVLLVFAAVVVAVTASLSDHEHWANFKATHNRNYELVEEKLRFQIFQNNLRRIEEHNQRYERGEVTYFLKQTEFADWTKEEFNNMLNYRPANVTSYESLQLDKNYVRPSSVDWREKGAVGPVKNQNPCGSCWAFSTTGSIEGQLRIHKKDNVLLSEQELVDCDTNNNACKGGIVGFAYMYIRKNGLSSEDQYPYIRKESGQCKAVANKPLKTLSGFTYLKAGEDILADAVATVGPISIGIAAHNQFDLYGGGVFSGDCGKEINHAVLAVGYSDDYWIVKNSWGSNWGEDGYIKLKRGRSLCQLGVEQCYPKL